MELQRTLDWYRARLGKVTGSEVSNLMKAGRKKDEMFGATAMSYINKKIYERCLRATLVNDDAAYNEYLERMNVETWAMRWGTDNEPVARMRYELEKNVKVEETGSVLHPEIECFAASPDGLVYDENGELEGVVEIKCLHENMMKYIGCKCAEDLKKVEDKYYWQTQAEMACTGAKWCDFVIYNPDLERDLMVIRIERVEEDIELMLNRVRSAEVLIKQGTELFLEP